MKNHLIVISANANHQYLTDVLATSYLIHLGIQHDSLIPSKNTSWFFTLIIIVIEGVVNNTCQCCNQVDDSWHDCISELRNKW